MLPHGIGHRANCYRVPSVESSGRWRCEAAIVSAFRAAATARIPRAPYQRRSENAGEDGQSCDGPQRCARDAPDGSGEQQPASQSHDSAVAITTTAPIANSAQPASVSKLTHCGTTPVPVVAWVCCFDAKMSGPCALRIRTDVILPPVNMATRPRTAMVTPAAMRSGLPPPRLLSNPS